MKKIGMLENGNVLVSFETEYKFEKTVDLLNSIKNLVDIIDENIAGTDGPSLSTILVSNDEIKPDAALIPDVTDLIPKKKAKITGKPTGKKKVKSKKKAIEPVDNKMSVKQELIECLKTYGEPMSVADAAQAFADLTDRNLTAVIKRRIGVALATYPDAFRRVSRGVYKFTGDYNQNDKKILPIDKNARLNLIKDLCHKQVEKEASEM